MDLKPINQRVKKLIDFYSKGNISDFSRRIGHSSQKINRLFSLDPRNGKYPEPSLEILQSIENTFSGINRNWLYKGEGQMLKKTEVSEVSDNTKMVPLVQQYAYAGYMSGYADEVYIDTLPKIPFVIDREYKGEYLCFEVRGDSMDDNTKRSYEAGDIILCREIRQDYWRSKLHIKNWSAFVIVHETEGIVIKQILQHDVEKGDLLLHSFNPLYDDFTVNLKDVKRIFNVVKSQKNR